MDRYEPKRNQMIWFITDVLFMYAITAVLLFLLAFAMYQTNLSVGIARGVIVAIFIISGFFGGFFIGKKMKEKKFLWGLGCGTVYFLILLIISLAVNGGVVDDLLQVLVKGILCIASSMAGGMVS